MTGANAKIKRIYVGDKQVRPVWKPNANTIAYYPLTSTTTTSDMKGSGIAQNLTNSNVSFGTQFGVDCAYISGNPDSQHDVSKYLHGNISGLPTGANARTFSFWIYNNNANNLSDSDDLYIFQGAGSANNMVFAFGGGIDNQGKLTISKRGGDNGEFGSISRRTRCYNVITYDGTKFEWYVNGESRGTWTVTINTSSNYFNIFGSNVNNYWNGFNGAMSSLILENKSRTAQEVADYYNQTKSNYGL